MSDEPKPLTVTISAADIGKPRPLDPTCKHAELRQHISQDSQGVAEGNDVQCVGCDGDMGAPPFCDGCRCFFTRSGRLWNYTCLLHRVVERNVSRLSCAADATFSVRLLTADELQALRERLDDRL